MSGGLLGICGGDNGIDGCRGRECGSDGLWRLTTQTPGIAYFPSAAFRNMILALFWERSTLRLSLPGSVMLNDEVERRNRGMLVRQRFFQPSRKVSIELISMQRQCMIGVELVILLLYRSPNARLQSLADDDSSAICLPRKYR